VRCHKKKKSFAGKRNSLKFWFLTGFEGENLTEFCIVFDPLKWYNFKYNIDTKEQDVHRNGKQPPFEVKFQYNKESSAAGNPYAGF
jgi:hypothetical protein